MYSEYGFTFESAIRTACRPVADVLPEVSTYRLESLLCFTVANPLPSEIRPIAIFWYPSSTLPKGENEPDRSIMLSSYRVPALHCAELPTSPYVLPSSFPEHLTPTVCKRPKVCPTSWARTDQDLLLTAIRPKPGIPYPKATPPIPDGWYWSERRTTRSRRPVIELYSCFVARSPSFCSAELLLATGLSDCMRGTSG